MTAESLARRPFVPAAPAIVGHRIELGGDPWGALLRWHQEGDGFVAITLDGRPVVLISDPALLAELFDRRGDCIRPGHDVDDERTQAHRRTVIRLIRQPDPFAVRARWLARLPALGAALAHAAGRGRSLDLRAHVGPWAWDAASLAFFQLSAGAESWRCALRMLDATTRAKRQLWHGMLPPLSWRVRWLDRAFLRARTGMRQAFGRSAGLDDADAAAESTGVLLAIVAQQLAVLGWSLRLVAEHPRWSAALRTAMRGLSPLEAAALAWDDALPHAGAIVLETLRLYPPDALLDREIFRPTTLADWPLTPGTSIRIPLWPLHRDARYWPQPDAFEPERWNGDAERVRYSYLAFGAGNGVCLGRALGERIGRAMLAFMVQSADWHPQGNWQPRLGHTLDPRGGYRFAADWRTGAG